MDLSESLLAQGRQVAQAEKLSVGFVVRDARALDYKAAFDVALSICEGALSLMETDEMERKILDNIAAALKPGGVFIATVPNAAFMLAQTSDDTTFDPVTHRETFTLDTVTAGGKSETLHCEQRYYTCPELKSLLAQTGFTEIEFFAVKPEGPTRDEQPSAHDFELGVIAWKKP
jgi:SAM-dependent methyltransferase